SSFFNDFPYEPAPAFPPAPAILDDTESNMLDNFFTTMNSSPLDNNDFWFNFNDVPTDKGLASSLNGNSITAEPQTNHDNTQSLLSVFEWPDETRPSFGLTTALPSPPFQANATSLQSHSASKTAAGIHHKPGPLSTGVPTAASMLYQNGPLPQYPSSSYPNQHHLSIPHPSIDAPRTKRPRVDFGMPPASSTITPPPSTNTTSPKPSAMTETICASGIYLQNLSTHTSAFTKHGENERACVNRVPLRWGSDASFSKTRYAAPPDQPSIEDQTRAMLKHLDCLEATQSPVANTCASSPVKCAKTHSNDSNQSVESPTSRDLKDLSLNDIVTDASTLPVTPLENGCLNKRRRSTKRGIDEESAPMRQSPKYRQTSVVTTSEGPKISASDRRSAGSRAPAASGNANSIATNGKHALPSSSPAPRRRSSASKAIRENLSEEQKRANHILSEQKRRDLIKNGFEDLCNLVPKLNGGGFSKSMMLVQAADWLEDLLKGNDLLKRRLLAMDGHAAV
ncbi:hypothetical protein KEM54_004576, partial [Ascosphaera aggregata]